MPILAEACMSTVESAICEEERFWTEQLTSGLRTLDVAVALQAADAALQLHRFMWTKERHGFRVSIDASGAGYEVHWSAKGLEAGSFAVSQLRKSLARDIWAAAFANEWAKSVSLVAAATKADSALEGYARKIGVEVPTLFADGDAASKASWRSVWDAMYGGRTSASE